MKPVDVVIVGGGVIGSAIAFNLLSIDSRLSVLVVERDPTYRTASSALSVSSIRQQFSTPVNIAMSRFSMAFYEEIAAHLAVDAVAPDIGLVRRGYLYLAAPAGADALKANYTLQRGCGVDVELLDAATLPQRFPWLATADLALGCLGLSGEGWFDGYGVLQAFRRKARAMGAAYVTGEAIGLEVNRHAIDAVLLADGARIGCAKVVNAAGPQAADIARMALIDLPVIPEKHSVFVFDCKNPPASCPLVIDPTGMYFRPEGRYFIAGPPRRADAPVDRPHLEVDYRQFDQDLWPLLAARVPAFESIKLVRAWAGYYEMNTFDHNAILGSPPEVPNLYFANGFSGHGMQHAPAAGLALAELILTGQFRTLDLTSLSYERLLRQAPVRELNVI